MPENFSYVKVYFNSQVANYINGGHYNPHHDYVFKEKDPNHVSFATICKLAPMGYGHNGTTDISSQL